MKEKIFITGGMLVVFSVTLATAGLLFLSRKNKEPFSDDLVETEVDYLIVLGARVHGDLPGKALENRLRAAKAYLVQHPNTIAILSGAKGEKAELSEAECMKRYLLAEGITEDRLITECRARSTIENLVFSIPLLPHDARTGVLTSDFHLKRTKLLARKTGKEDFSFFVAVSEEKTSKLTVLREKILTVWAFLK